MSHFAALVVTLWVALGTSLVVSGGGRPAQAGTGLPLLKYVPDDVNAALGLNLARSRGTPLFRKSLELGAAELPELWKKLGEIKFDPAKDLDTVVLATRLGGDADPPFVAIMEGRLGALEIELRSRVATAHLGVDVWTFDDAAVFVIDKRAVWCSPALIDDVIRTVKGKRSSAKASRRTKALRAGIAAADPRGELWLALQGKAIHELPVSGALAWVSMSAATGKGLAMAVKAQADSEQTATSMVEWIGGQLPIMKQLVSSQGLGSMADSFEVKNTGALLAVGLVMADSELAKVLTFLSHHASP